MRLVVTGGAGYIGSIATRLLLDAGHEVVVIDSLERGHRAAVDRRATLIIASVGDADVLDAVLPGVEGIVHFAGYIDVAESVREPESYRQKNVEEPRVLLDRAIAAGVKWFVFSSSAAVYGEPSEVPIPEEAPISPVNPYGASKAEFERILTAAEERKAIAAMRLRYFNVAGAWPDGSLGEAHPVESHIVPTILRRVRDAEGSKGAAGFTIFGNDYPTPDGTCIRDYVHVADLAAAHLAATEYLAGGGTGMACNLGSGRGYSNLEVVRACASVIGREIEVVYGPRREGDPARLVASVDRARAVLGWSPTRDLETMVADAWRWHRLHPHGYGERP